MEAKTIIINKVIYGRKAIVPGSIRYAPQCSHDHLIRL